MTLEALSKSVGPSLIGFVTDVPDANQIQEAATYQVFLFPENSALIASLARTFESVAQFGKLFLRKIHERRRDSDESGFIFCDHMRHKSFLRRIWGS